MSVLASLADKIHDVIVTGCCIVLVLKLDLYPPAFYSMFSFKIWQKNSNIRELFRSTFKSCTGSIVALQHLHGQQNGPAARFKVEQKDSNMKSNVSAFCMF